MTAASVGGTTARSIVSDRILMVSFWAKNLLFGFDFSIVMIFGYMKLSGSIREKFIIWYAPLYAVIGDMMPLNQCTEDSCLRQQKRNRLRRRWCNF
jgi:hypothetical protein